MDLAGVVEAVGSAREQVRARRRGLRPGQGLLRRVRALRWRASWRPSPRTSASSRRRWSPPPGCPPCRACATTGRLRPGQSALIIGASGGVGTYAVQLAKAFGAEVTGVCSTAKVDMVRSIGADHVIDYTHDDFAQGERRYDLILDIGGNASLSRLRRALTPKGTLVIAGGETGGRWLGGTDRQIRALVLSRFVQPAAGHLHLAREPRGHDRPQGAHRSGEGHAGRSTAATR